MTDHKTPTGVIHYDSVCKDNYPNIEIEHDNGTIIKLQAAAMRAFENAEAGYAKRSGWSVARIKREGGRKIELTGSWRSCEYQAELYRSDSQRYASPNVSGHCRGICIDVSTNVANQEKIRAALKAEGWVQVRSDEPWHYSYGVAV